MRHGDWIGEGETGHDLAHRAVPIEAAFVDQHGEAGDGEGLGDRADGENSIGRHRHLVFDVAKAVASAIERLAVPDDADREAGNLPLGHDRLGEFIETGERLWSALFDVGGIGRAWQAAGQHYRQ